jgi:BlaI family transcriptional regulator, penicillinase repressor
MDTQSHVNLSRRERQIMDVIYRRSEASALEVLEGIPDPPSYSAVRAMLRVLEDKGYVRHKRIGRRYVFTPTVSRDKATRSVLKNLLSTFFDGSVEKAVAALLDVDATNLSEHDYDRLARLVEKARKEGR